MTRGLVALVPFVIALFGAGMFPSGSLGMQPRSAFAARSSVRTIVLRSYTRVAGAARYNIDYIDAGAPINPAANGNVPLAVASGHNVKLAGWAIDAKHGAPAGGFVVTVDGKTNYLADYGTYRPDVAKYFRNSALSHTGFTMNLTTHGWSPGVHNLTFAVLAHSGKAYYAGTTRISLFVARAVDTSHMKRLTGDVFFGLDLMNGRPPSTSPSHPLVIRPGQGIYLQGWAVDGKARGPARGVVLAVDGTHDYQALYGLSRPDVARHFGVAAYAHSGFVAAIPTADLAGEHFLVVRVLARNGDGYYESSQKFSFVVNKSVSLASLRRLKGQPTYGIDFVDSIYLANLRNHVLLVPAHSVMTIGGWAIDARANTPAGAVVVTIDGSRNILAAYGLYRPDVAQHFHNKALTNTGFSASIPTSEIGVGRHSFQIDVYTRDGKAYYRSSNKVTFIVR